MRRRPFIPRTVRPDGAERLTRKRLVALLADLSLVARAVTTGRLARLLDAGPHGSAPGNFAALLEDLDAALRGTWARHVPDAQAASAARVGATATSAAHAEGWDRQLAAVGQGARKFRPRAVVRRDVAARPIGAPQASESALLDDAVRNSVALIKGVVVGRFFDQLVATVRGGVLAGDRHEDLASELETRFFDPGSGGLVGARKRAELVARDQTLKLYGNLARIRQTSAGVERYVWRTARDERVRPEHASREGETFSWDDPPVEDDYDGAPGQPINCRCVPEPVFDDLPDDEPEEDEEVRTDALLARLDASGALARYLSSR